MIYMWSTDHESIKMILIYNGNAEVVVTIPCHAGAQMTRHGNSE